MKCESCRAYNAHVIYLENEKWILCPRCLTILKRLNEEYLDIVGYNSTVSVDEVPSTSSRGD